MSRNQLFPLVGVLALALVVLCFEPTPSESMISVPAPESSIPVNVPSDIAPSLTLPPTMIAPAVLAPSFLNDSSSPSSTPSGHQCFSNTSCPYKNSYCNNGTCACLEPFYGATCSVECTREKTCSGKGYCMESGTCYCDGMWQDQNMIGADCTNPWLIATVSSVMGALFIISLIMIGCFIRNSCCDAEAKQGYYPIQ